jgi:hypothetical protein
MVKGLSAATTSRRWRTRLARLECTPKLEHDDGIHRAVSRRHRRDGRCLVGHANARARTVRRHAPRLHCDLSAPRQRRVEAVVLSAPNDSIARPHPQRARPLRRRLGSCYRVCGTTPARRTSLSALPHPAHPVWEAVVLPLNYARTDSVFRHSADGVPTKTGTSVPLYHRGAAPSSSTSSTAPRSVASRPWPPPHKRRNPAAFAGRGVSQIGHLRATSTTTAKAKSLARWRQTNSADCHSVSRCIGACVPGFDRWGAG